jgi:hypothetical protein
MQLGKEKNWITLKNVWMANKKIREIQSDQFRKLRSHFINNKIELEQ